jgi:hypothetical protein
LPTAFAICLGIDVEDIFKWLGHDGSEIIYSDTPEPYCRRSFHPQELIDYCFFEHDIHVMQIESEVQLSNAHNESIYKVPLQKWRIRKYFKQHNVSVLTGQVKDNRRWHAVARINEVIYDPNGSKTQLNTFLGKFNITTLFLILT